MLCRIILIVKFNKSKHPCDDLIFLIVYVLKDAVKIPKTCQVMQQLTVETLSIYPSYHCVAYWWNNFNRYFKINKLLASGPSFDVGCNEILIVDIAVNQYAIRFLPSYFHFVIVRVVLHLPAFCKTLCCSMSDFCWVQQFTYGV